MAGRSATLQLAAGSRNLVREIATEGQAAWRGRLESVLSGSLKRTLNTREQTLLDELCAGLPPDIFRQMEQQWFGNKANGIAAIESGDDRARSSLVSFTQDDDLLLGTPEKPKQASASESAGRFAVSDADESADIVGCARQSFAQKRKS